MRSCCQSLIREITVLNLIASQGFIFQFCEQISVLIILTLLGNSGRGVLASGILGICIYLTFQCIQQGILNSLRYYLKDNQNKQKWITVAVLSSLIICAVFLMTNILCILVVFPVLPLKVSVLRRAAWFAVLLVPFLFTTGLRTVLIQHHDAANRTRPIIVSSVIFFIFLLCGALILLFTFPMGLTGCAILMNASQCISTLFLVASLGELSSYKRSLKVAFQKFCIPAEKLKKNLDSRACFWSARKIGIDPLNTNPAESSTTTMTLELSSVSNRKQVSRKSLNRVRQRDDEQDSNSDSEQEELLNSDNDINRGASNDIVAFDYFRHLMRFMFGGFPSALSLWTDISWYIVSPFIISSMGSYAVDTFFIQVAVVRFLVWSTIYPVSVASAIKIRAYLKSGHYDDCNKIVWLGFLQVSAIGIFFSFLLYIGRSFLWYWFSRNSSIIHRCADSAVFIAPYCLAYCYSIWANGILRASGESWSFTAWSFLAFWIVGCPLGTYFGIFSRPVYNLMGYWIGWITGTGLLAVTATFHCLFLISWKKKYRKLIIKFDNQFSEESNPLHDRSILSSVERGSDTSTIEASQIQLHHRSDFDLFDDISTLSVYGCNMGSFTMRPNTLEDDLLEIQIEQAEEAM